VSEILPSAGDVIYEVDFDADAAIEGPFDTWLRDHIADVLQFPGFLSAEILAGTVVAPGRIRRTVQYRLRDRAALDDYLERHAQALDAQGAALLGGRFVATPRVLAHREEFIRGAVSTENCLNCGEVLTGQHCAHCGQRATVRVLSLWGMTRDLLGDMLDWDARIWRTLRPLAFSPGRLTQEYLRGRRASYTPPFRMYVLLSVAFFLVATTGSDPGSALRFNVDDKGGASLEIAGDDGGSGSAPPSAQQLAGAPATPAVPEPELDAETTQLIEAFVKRLPEKDRAKARSELTTKISGVPAENLGRVKEVMKDPCSPENLKFEVPWGKEYEPRLRQACRKIWSDTPSFGRALFQNIPKMMFIFLPLIAVVMYLLYIGSGRYYVEHLLFVVHFHAFFFLGGLVILLVERTAWLAPGTTFAAGAKGVGNFLMAAFAVYVPVYLFVAMRRVYGQGRLVTFLKYSALGIAYLTGLVITALGLLFYTALTL
jgi:Protein of unknown function (DUF3667)/Domain of unknown function (DUF4286)